MLYSIFGEPKFILEIYLEVELILHYS